MVAAKVIEVSGGDFDGSETWPPRTSPAEPPPPIPAGRRPEAGCPQKARNLTMDLKNRSGVDECRCWHPGSAEKFRRLE